MKKIIFALALSATALVQAQTLETKQINSVIRQGGVDLAWARGITGQGVTIGIIDQGFDQTHGDFLNKITASRNFYSKGTVTWAVHGTQMASIAAGARNSLGTVGVAPDAKLMLAQVGAGGNNQVLSEPAIYAALDWLSASGASVINMSLGAEYSSGFTRSIITNGRGSYFAGSDWGVNYGSTNAELAAFAQAATRGSILVVSAGNQGLPYASFPAMFASRTDASNRLVLGGRMIVVGAVDSSNRIASFSNQAGHLCQNAQGTVCRDVYLTRDFYVVAPGVDVLASVPNQLGLGRNTVGTSTGTSPAAAYVSGGMALMRQVWPQLKSEQIVNLVLTTAKDLGTPGIDNVYGRGLVDFNKATQPQGQLVVAAKNLKISSGTVSGIGLRGTGLVSTSGFASALQTSTVLGNTQVLDELGRNYTANLQSAALIRNVLTNPQSPWLGYTGYRQAQFDLTDSAQLTVFPGQTGSAAQLDYLIKHTRLQFQLGSMSESSGYLGNYGAGAVGLGSSQTVWAMLGIEQTVKENWSLFAQYGQGKTQVVNDPVSMIETITPVLTTTWRFGINANSVFENRDKVSIGLGTPVRIQHGKIRVTGVVGYNYENLNDDEYQAVPIVASEILNLSSPKNLSINMNYLRPVGKNSVLSLNAGQILGSGYTIGAQFTWLQ